MLLVHQLLTIWLSFVFLYPSFLVFLLQKEESIQDMDVIMSTEVSGEPEEKTYEGTPVIV